MPPKGGLPQVGGFDDLKDLLVSALDDHGKATAAIFSNWGSGKKVDVVNETSECFDRAFSTAAKFVMFWDNIATLMAMGDLPPINHAPPPVGGPGLMAIFPVDAPGVVSATPGKGLRRRGAPPSPPSVDPSKITVSTSPNVVTVTVDCEGVPRGLYEGELDATDSAGAHSRVLYNVYVNPV